MMMRSLAALRPTQQNMACASPMSEVSSSAAALLAKLDGARSPESSDEREIVELQASILQLKAQIAAEDSEVQSLAHDHESIASQLSSARAEHTAVNGLLQQQWRVESRQQGARRVAHPPRLFLSRRNMHPRAFA